MIYCKAGGNYSDLGMTWIHVSDIIPSSFAWNMVQICVEIMSLIWQHQVLLQLHKRERKQDRAMLCDDHYPSGIQKWHNSPTAIVPNQCLFLLFGGSLARSNRAYHAPAKQPPAPISLQAAQSALRLASPPSCPCGGDSFMTISDY